jgi:hypothetical protein
MSRVFMTMATVFDGLPAELIRTLEAPGTVHLRYDVRRGGRSR